MTIDTAAAIVDAVARQHKNFRPLAGLPIAVSNGQATVTILPLSIGQASIIKWFKDAGAMLTSYGIECLTTGNVMLVSFRSIK